LKADIQEGLNSHTAELTEEGLEKVTELSKSGALRKGLQMADELVHHLGLTI
jgi:hypothetical protein